jgi:hypothetical protein
MLFDGFAGGCKAVQELAQDGAGCGEALSWGIREEVTPHRFVGG